MCRIFAVATQFKLHDLRLTEIRYFGVIFYQHLNFNWHIALVITKAYSMLRFVRRICKRFTWLYMNALKLVFFAHVRSYLEYASFVWSPLYSANASRIKSNKNKSVFCLHYTISIVVIQSILFRHTRTYFNVKRANFKPGYYYFFFHAFVTIDI